MAGELQPHHSLVDAIQTFLITMVAAGLKRTGCPVISVVIPVSPIKSHPDTTILTETVESVRHHLPDAEIFITFDGVREEQDHRRGDYEEFIRRALWSANHVWKPVVPFIFDTHQHQTGMLRAILNDISTPLLMYVEQDTPLVVDEAIDFPLITDFIESGQSNAVRLHHEAVIPVDHEHMIHGVDSGFIRTSQWSQRPHIASVAFYRRIMDCYFSDTAKCFIEDRMHGVIDQAFLQDGLLGWHQHKLHIYNPGVNLKRSYHSDGRAGENKYDDTQIF